PDENEQEQNIQEYRGHQNEGIEAVAVSQEDAQAGEQKIKRNGPRDGLECRRTNAFGRKQIQKAHESDRGGLSPADQDFVSSFLVLDDADDTVRYAGAGLDLHVSSRLT